MFNVVEKHVQTCSLLTRKSVCLTYCMQGDDVLDQVGNVYTLGATDHFFGTQKGLVLMSVAFVSTFKGLQATDILYCRKKMSIFLCL